MQKDLFGNRVKSAKPKYQATLERFDRHTLPARLERLQWLQKVFPKGYGFLMPPETAFVFEEARMAFINGQFISTVLLCSAFIEHRFGSHLESCGYREESKSGLSGILKTMRRYNMVSESLLDSLDELREIRNPFVHLKPILHSKRITLRSFKRKLDFATLLEEDAKRGISLMYQAATTRLS